MGNWITHSQTSEWWCVCRTRKGNWCHSWIPWSMVNQWSANGHPHLTWPASTELTLLPSPASQCPMSLAISVINRCVRFGC